MGTSFQMEHVLEISQFFVLVLKMIPRAWKMAETICTCKFTKGEWNIHRPIDIKLYEELFIFLIRRWEVFKINIFVSKFADLETWQLWSSALLQCAFCITKLIWDSFNVYCSYTRLLQGLDKNRQKLTGITLNVYNLFGSSMMHISRSKFRMFSF